MKKTIFFTILGSVVAGAVLLSGVTYAFGAIAEAGVRYAATSKPNEESPMKWDIDLGDYARGLFSSQTSSRLHLSDGPADAEEESDEDGTPLKHVIYHGPLAMTPEGPKFCSYHIVTTLKPENMKAEVRDSLKKSFSGSEPLTIQTTTGFGGTQVTRVEVASFSYEDEEMGLVNFTGATAKLATGPDMAFANGEFKSGALTMNLKGIAEMDLEIAPSSGSFDYIKDSKLTANATFGAMKGDAPGAKLSMAESDGEIDWLKSTHLKGHFKLGSIEIGGPEEAVNVVAGPGIVSVDYKRVSDAFDLLLGEAKLHLEKVEADVQGQQVSMNDFVIRFDTGEKSGKLYALVGYDIGGLQAPESPDMPLAFGQIAGKGFKFEYGIEGLDLATVESLATKGRELTELEGFNPISDFSNPENPDQLEESPENNEAIIEASPENNEAVVEMSRLMMDLIQPGLETYYTVKVRGETGISLAEVRLGMGGDKKLTEMKTGREMLSSITGKATARVSKSQFPPEQIEALIADGPAAPYVVEHLDRFEALAELKDGNFSINGEANPLLDDLGPSLDEEFDWDAFLAGMAAGIGGPN